jgi:hypothetical protein
VVSRFHCRSTQWAGWAVVPIPAHQPVRSSNPILENEPREELSFWGCPRFPNRGELRCSDAASELGFVC